MIKYIAFDLVGVLVNEKDISLTPEEEKLEKMFGPNINDSDYMSFQKQTPVATVEMMDYLGILCRAPIQTSWT